jgi:hypothetical protein
MPMLMGITRAGVEAGLPAPQHPLLGPGEGPLKALKGQPAGGYWAGCPVPLPRQLRRLAVQTIAELQAEIATLQCLEHLALEVRQSRADRKWDELSRLLLTLTEDRGGRQRVWHNRERRLTRGKMPPGFRASRELAGKVPLPERRGRQLPRGGAGRLVPRQRLRPLRRSGQRLGVVRRLVPPRLLRGAHRRAPAGRQPAGARR